MKSKHYLIGFIICIMLLVSLACNIMSFLDGPSETQIQQERDIRLRQTADKATATFLQITPDYIWDEEPEKAAGNENNNAITGENSNTNNKFIFNYAGENQSYHTGLRNRTVFYIDYDTGMVTAMEEANFEEPFGTQTSRGTDTVKFNGSYDDTNKTIVGNLSINTTATATGGESGPSTITYTMTGILSADFFNDKWGGTVEGNATLTQTWPEGPNPDSVTPYTIAWTIKGTPVE
jgi:hypothetical protein